MRLCSSQRGNKSEKGSWEMRGCGHVQRGVQTAARNTNAGVSILFKLRRDIYLIPSGERSYQRDLRCINGTSRFLSRRSRGPIGNNPRERKLYPRLSPREKRLDAMGDKTFRIKEVTL